MFGQLQANVTGAAFFVLIIYLFFWLQVDLLIL